MVVAGATALIALMPPAERGAQLEVSEMSVIGDADVRAHFEDMSMRELGVEEGHVSGDGLDIKVRNTGDTVAVVTAVRVRVDEARPLDVCELVGGDQLDVSRLYDAELPADAGTTVEVPVSQAVGADEADRFVVTVGVDGTSGARVYALSASLVVDGDEVNLGQAVVAAPWPWRNKYFYGTGDGGCEQRNTDVLEDMLSGDVRHSVQLAEVADPDAIRAGRGEPEDPVNECGVVAGAFGTVNVTFVSANVDMTCDEAIDVVSEYARRRPATTRSSAAGPVRRTRRRHKPAHWSANATARPAPSTSRSGPERATDFSSSTGSENDWESRTSSGTRQYVSDLPAPAAGRPG